MASTTTPRSWRSASARRQPVPLTILDQAGQALVSDPVTSFDESTLKTFPARFESLEEQGVLTPTVTLARLGTALSAAQRAIVDQIINLDPRDYGVSTPYAGDLEPVPADLVKVSGQQYAEHGEQKTMSEKYVPRHIFGAYVRMNDAFMAQHRNRRLLIQSCYRSPAYQVAVFINWLINGYDGDIAKTIRHASPPRYSQHTIASKAAIDFRNIDGSPSSGNPEDFKDTIEYAWLRQHGGEFGFYESWPAGNEFGMRAEPWHWQHRSSCAIGPTQPERTSG
jgi:D-alanyl-D-alanine carboxypeptidase